MPFHERPEIHNPDGSQFPLAERPAAEPVGRDYPAASWPFQDELTNANSWDSFSSSFPGEDHRFIWPDHSPAMSSSAVRYNESRRRSPLSVKYDAGRSNRRVNMHQLGSSEPLRFSRAGVEWPESLPLEWPRLPEETASHEDAELRVVRALEHRSRLDREQSGMTWSEPPF
jgi:hypothetical protein